MSMPKTTYTLIKITDRKRALDLKEKGIIYFGQPKNWIDFSIKFGDNRIGDIKEGTYLCDCVLNNNHKKIIRNNTIIREIEGLKYYYDENILECPTYCMYGVNDTSFSGDIIEHNNIRQKVSQISFDYFKDFNNGLSKHDYDLLTKMKQKVVILIEHPEKFVEELFKSLYALGFNQNEIFISPVEYMNKKSSFCYFPPYELFHKDSNYSNQNEIRIVLFSNDKNKLEKLKLSNYAVSINNISRYIHILDMYYKPMLIAIQNNESFLYELPNTIVTDFKDMNFEDLLYTFIEYVSTKNYELEKSNNPNYEEYYEGINYFINLFKTNFGIIIQIEPKSDGTNALCFKNLSSSQNDYLEKLLTNFDFFHKEYNLCIFPLDNK